MFRDRGNARHDDVGLDGGIQEVKRLFVAVIEAYRRVPRGESGRRCLFAESCSSYVLRMTETRGPWAGLKVMVERIRRCRGGYRVLISPVDHEVCVRLADGTVVAPEAMSRFVMGRE